MTAARAIQAEPGLPDGGEQQCVGGRLHDGLADAAPMRQVVERATDRDPDAPTSSRTPARRVAADVGRRADERQLGERTKGDPPVTDFIASIAQCRLMPRTRRMRQRKGE